MREHVLKLEIGEAVRIRVRSDEAQLHHLCATLKRRVAEWGLPRPFSR